jgi:hypothetical protein
MSRHFHRQLCLPLTLLVCMELAASLRAQPTSTPPKINMAKASPPPVLRPPLAFFRELLAMTPEQREQHLDQWTPEKRARLLAKITYYEHMSPAEREQSLTATELHWYLQQFLLKPSTNSGIELSQVPEPYRQMVSDRLTMWQILPPPLQQDVLTHETTRDFFMLGARSSAHAGVPLQIIPPPLLQQAILQLDVLPPDRRQQTYAHFQSFFELTAGEKQAVLDTLPSAERQRFEKTIAGLELLPQKQRESALRSLAQVAGLTDKERREFFEKMGHWEQLSPDEKEVWARLANHLPPLPPLPPPMPPLPPPLPPIPQRSDALPALSSATNPSH